MSSCPTITFQLANVPKTLAKNIMPKVSFKISLLKRHVLIAHLR